MKLVMIDLGEKIMTVPARCISHVVFDKEQDGIGFGVEGTKGVFCYEAKFREYEKFIYFLECSEDTGIYSIKKAIIA